MFDYYIRGFILKLIGFFLVRYFNKPEIVYDVFHLIFGYRSVIADKYTDKVLLSAGLSDDWIYQHHKEKDKEWSQRFGD